MAQNRKSAICGAAAAVMIGWCISVITSLLVAAIAAFLISEEKLSEEVIDTVAGLTVIICGFVGAFATATKAVRNKILMCVTTAAAYYLTLISVTIMCLDGTFYGVWITALVLGLSAIAAGVCCMKPNKKRKVHHAKMRRHRICAKCTTG